MVSAAERREVAKTLKEDYKFSIDQACTATGLSRASWYRQPSNPKADEVLIQALNALMERFPRWGFWKCFDRLCLDGHTWNHKRVWRVYCEMGLNLPRRKKRILLERERQPLEVMPIVNASWAMDFMHDVLYGGKRFRTLNILDEGVRECLDIEIDTSLPASRVVQVLDRISEWRGYPKQLRMDNGPELISEKLIQWCEQHHVKMIHIQPGKPNQNAYIERFNRSFRYEVLDAHLFNSLTQVRDIAEAWRIDYNELRPHDALNGMTPTAFREQSFARNSSLELST